MAENNIGINVNLTGAEESAKKLSYIEAAASSFASKTSSKLVSMFSAVAVGAMVFDKIGEAMSKNIATAKQIGSLSAKFHIDPKEVHSLMLSANDAGVQVRGLLMGMKQLGQYASKAIVDPDKADILKQMGFDMSRLNELASKPAAHLGEISEGLMRIGNENDRNKVGVMLLGRQYQQLLPMIEKLGTSAEARAEYLNNENAMSAEQVEAAKEMAREQSKMNEEWEKLIASLIPVASTILSVVNLVKDMAKWVWNAAAGFDAIAKKGAKDTQESLVRRTKTLTAAAKDGNLSEADKKDFEEWSKKHGSQSIEEWAAKRAGEKEEASEDAGTSDTGVGQRMVHAYKTGATAGQRADPNKKFGIAGKLWDTLPTGPAMGIGFAAKEGFDSLLASTLGVRTSTSSLQVEQRNKITDETTRLAREKEAKAAANERERNMKRKDFEMQRDVSLLDAKGEDAGRGDKKTTSFDKRKKEWDNKQKSFDEAEAADKETESKNAKSITESLDSYVKEGTKDYDKNYDAWLAKMSKLSGAYNKDLANVLQGLGFDVSYNERTKEIVKGHKKDNVDAAGENIEITDTPAEKKQQRKDEKQQRALKRSERHKRGGESGVELAGEKARDAAEDAADAKKDLDVARAAEEPKRKALEAAKAEEARLKAELAATMKKQNGVLDKDQRAAYNKEIGAAQTNVSGAKAELEKAKDERVGKELAANKAEDAALIAQQALEKAKDAEWAKEKKHQDDLHKDAMDDIAEQNEEKYRTMKLNGASETEIAEERFNDEMKMYLDSVKEKEALDAEIQARRDARYEKTLAEGGDEADLGAAYEMTDEEMAMTRGKREGVDAARKKTESALFAIDPKAAQSAAVVSDLGKLGGGGAVQFGGTNPVDEIRKSNKWLEIIAKAATSDKIANAGAFGNFLDENEDYEAGAEYGAKTPSR